MSTSDREIRLERWYRRLLLAYPAAFRRERGEEVVSTLLSAGEPGRRGLPSILDAANLVSNGLRTRVRGTRRALRALRTAEVSHGAGLVILAVATAAAIALTVAVTVDGRPMFDAARNLNRTYPLPARLGLAAVLAAFPAALAAALADRTRLARWLATLGAGGSAGFAVWLIAYALRTRNESIEVSNLFGLVTLLCVPAVLLRRGDHADQPADQPAGHRRDIRPIVALTALLAVPLVLLVASHHAEDDGRGLRNLEQLSSRLRWGSVHDTGLTQGIVAALIVLAAWHLLRALLHPELHRDEPRHLAVAWTAAAPMEPRDLAVVWALALPAWGYALGTFLTPMFFRPEALALPGDSRLTGLAQHVLELSLASALIAALAVLTLGALQRTPHQDPSV